LSGCFLGGVCFLFFKKAQAYQLEKYPDQIEDRFLVTPSKLDLQLRPGQKIVESFQVINRLGREQIFEIIVEDLLENSSDKKKENSIKDWVDLEIKEFVLGQGERMRLSFTINVPEKLFPGGYYASLLVVAKNRDQKNENIELVSRIGIPLLATVPGEFEEKGIISKLETNRYFYWRGPVEIFSSFQNQGNVHLNPRGEIAVYNFLGAKVAQMSLAEAVVLPNQEKNWKTVWQKKWLLGYYPVILTVHYGENFFSVKKISFWAFPLDILFLAILLLWIIHKVLDKFSLQIEIKRKKSFKK